MRLSILEQQLEDFIQHLPEIPANEVVRLMGNFSEQVKKIEGEMKSRRDQREKESKTVQLIEKLEGRCRVIRDSAQEYEATALNKQAHTIYIEAESIHNKLLELKKRIFAERKAQFSGLQRDVEKLKPKVDDLEKRFDALLANIAEKEKTARKEDAYPEDVRKHILLGRISEFFTVQGDYTYSHLNKKRSLYTNSSQILKTLESESSIEEHDEMKEYIRLKIQDIDMLLSEGFNDKDIEGNELSLPYAMRKKWNCGDKQAFYKRLWTLNYLLLEIGTAYPELTEKVRALLTLINDKIAQDAETMKFANDAKRFCMMAGNGVIRRFLEETYNGLKLIEDYARLGRDLHNPPHHIHVLQLAVNIPRLYDLSLNTKTGKIMEERIQRKDSRNITPYLEIRTTDDIEDLPRVLPEEFTKDWPIKLLQKELPAIFYQDQTESDVEIGQEETTEAQLFIMDDSGSMYGCNKYILRNAIYISALNTFSIDAAKKRDKNFRNLLFARMFGSNVGNLFTVKNQSEALLRLKEYIKEENKNDDTNLQLALITAYDDIKQAKGTLKGLRSAKVVVVTDAQVSLNINPLLEAQKSGGVPITTHVFSLEQEHDDIKKLCAASGAGKAFYYYIPKADAPELRARPPYGTPEEFSPIFEEPFFKSTQEKEAFERSVQELCDQIVELSRKDERKRKDEEKVRSREFEELFKQNGGFRKEPYEAGHNPSDTDQRIRKSNRVLDILEVIKQIRTDIDKDMTYATIMILFRHLAESRGVLGRDYRKILKTTSNEKILEILQDIKLIQNSKIKNQN